MPASMLTCTLLFSFSNCMPGERLALCGWKNIVLQKYAISIWYFTPYVHSVNKYTSVFYSTSNNYGRTGRHTFNLKDIRVDYRPSESTSAVHSFNCRAAKPRGCRRYISESGAGIYTKSNQIKSNQKREFI